ncbi:MAG TPA: glycosyl hydrolase 115 family protein [Thermoguttaceae bacterium]|nr:glycosyl hydrolase 115 family protein [Thermoguttaceae bacterium]
MTSIFSLCIAVLLPAPALAGFELVGEKGTATVLVPEGEPGCVRLAAEDLAGDVEKITGRSLPIVSRPAECTGACVLLGTVGNPKSAELLERLLPGVVAELSGKWEAYRARSVAAEGAATSQTLVIAGSDERGTMFGLYAFIEQYLKVDPLYFWAARPPENRDRLAWDAVRLAADEPTFKYRGWFINDEDLLSEWHLDGGRRRIDYPYYEHVVSPRVSRRVFEAMVRLGYNLVIPASFVDLRNADEARLVDEAARRGLFVSMHHVEPLGVSGFGFATYWRERGEEVPFSYTRYPEKFEIIWRDYARRWARYPNVVWQLGLRGIADRPVWVSDPEAPQSDEARGRLISEAMAKQWEIVRSVDPRPDPPATTTLWMEGSDLHRRGHLRFPPGVAVIFADNSPGWELQSDFYEVTREPGRPYGVYYHQALWGTGPHLVQGVSPKRAHGIFAEAVGRGSTHYAIMNVSNVRELVLGIDAAARFLRDFDGFDPDRYLDAWCAERFGPAAEAARGCYERLFASYVAGCEEGSRNKLDGEILHNGRRFYEVLLERLRVETQPSFQDSPRIERTLVQVQRQRAAVEAAGEEIDVVSSRLDGADRAFFESNFVAQHAILLGLLRWWEHGLEAGLSLRQGDRTKMLAHLRSAQGAIRQIRAGQALASRGQWKHWYRGDRKMNLARVEGLTDEVIAAGTRP